MKGGAIPESKTNGPHDAARGGQGICNLLATGTASRLLAGGVAQATILQRLPLGPGRQPVFAFTRRTAWHHRLHGRFSRNARLCGRRSPARLAGRSGLGRHGP